MWTAIEDGVQNGRPFYRIMTQDDKDDFSAAFTKRIMSLKENGFDISQIDEKTYFAKSKSSAFKIYACYTEDPEDDTDLFSRFYLFRDNYSFEVCHDLHNFDFPRTLVYLHRIDKPSDKKLIFYMNRDVKDEAAVAAALLKVDSFL